jgi:hypothetical protein
MREDGAKGLIFTPGGTGLEFQFAPIHLSGFDNRKSLGGLLLVNSRLVFTMRLA